MKVKNNLDFILALTLSRFALSSELLDLIETSLTRPQLSLLDKIRKQLHTLHSDMLGILPRFRKALLSESLETDQYTRLEEIIDPTKSALNDLNSLIHSFTISPEFPSEFFAFIDQINPLLSYSDATGSINTIQAVVLFSPQNLYERFDLQVNEFIEVENIVRLPYLDLYNPLMWPAIVHEYGHIASRIKAPEIAADENNKPEFDVISNWEEEFFSDIFAAKRVGASYVLASISYFSALSVYDFHATRQHPNFGSRLKAMLASLDSHSPFYSRASSLAKGAIKYAKAFNVPEETTSCQIALDLHERFPDYIARNVSRERREPVYVTSVTPKQLRRSAFEHYNSISWIAQDESPRLSAPELDKLAKELIVGTPIPAVIDIKDLTDILKQIESHRKNGKSLDKKSLTTRYKEIPLSSSTIVNVAWSVFLDTISRDIVNISTDKDLTVAFRRDAISDVYCQFNNCVLKSIEASQILSVWRQDGAKTDTEGKE